MSKIHQPGTILPLGKERAVAYLKVSHLAPEVVEIPAKKVDLFFKRCFDMALSFFVIVFALSWLLPILAILIKINSRGPVFFIQKRVGAFGKTFNCFKLRTMVVNEQANTCQAQLNDPRITSFGKFLRLSCFDELPQFFNVLLGDMSIVGPRPHMLRDCKEFSKVVKNYNSRCFVKPGITGMAQVKGYRGKTDNYYDISHRYKWDMFYVRNISFNLDMRILRLTLTTTLATIFSTFFTSKTKEAVPEYCFEATEYLN